MDCFVFTPHYKLIVPFIQPLKFKIATLLGGLLLKLIGVDYTQQRLEDYLYGLDKDRGQNPQPAGVFGLYKGTICGAFERNTKILL